MKGFLFVLVLLVIGIVGFGFYQGWFNFSKDTTDNKPSVTIMMHPDKIQKDEKKVQDFGEKLKDKTGDRTDKAKEQERQP